MYIVLLSCWSLKHPSRISPFIPWLFSNQFCPLWVAVRMEISILILPIKFYWYRWKQAFLFGWVERTRFPWSHSRFLLSVGRAYPSQCPLMNRLVDGTASTLFDTHAPSSMVSQSLGEVQLARKISRRFQDIWKQVFLSLGELKEDEMVWIVALDPAKWRDSPWWRRNCFFIYRNTWKTTITLISTMVEIASEITNIQ